MNRRSNSLNSATGSKNIIIIDEQQVPLYIRVLLRFIVPNAYYQILEAKGLTQEYNIKVHFIGFVNKGCLTKHCLKEYSFA